MRYEVKKSKYMNVRMYTCTHMRAYVCVMFCPFSLSHFIFIGWFFYSLDFQTSGNTVLLSFSLSVTDPHHLTGMNWTQRITPLCQELHAPHLHFHSKSYIPHELKFLMKQIQLSK